MSSDSAPPVPGNSWIRDALNKKADYNWVHSEIKNIRRSTDDTKATATKAANQAAKPHICLQLKEIDELQAWQAKVMSFKVTAIISILVLVVGAVGQYLDLKDSVEDGNQEKVTIQKTLLQIEIEQTKTSKVIQALKSQEHSMARKQKEDLKEIFRELLEVRADIKPTRREGR